MTQRGTIILLGLAITLLGWFFVDLHQTQPSDGPLFHFNPENVSRIVITDGNDSHSLQRDDDSWKISTTPPDRASEKEVTRLLTIARELKPLNILNPKELKNKLSLSSLGLQNPKRSLTIHQEGKSDQTLFIGNEAIGEKSLFARMDQQKAVVIIPSTLADLAFRSSDDFRDSYLTSLQPNNLQEIAVTQGASKLCLKKENQEWQMTQPITSPISSDVLEAWITPLLKTEILTRVKNDDGDLSAYGLDQPRATISLLAENSSEPIILSLGNLVEKNEAKDLSAEPPAVYLRSSARHSIFKVPAFLTQVFMISPESLRNHQFFQLNLDTVDRIEITSAGKTTTLHRQKGGSEDWVLEDKNQTVVPKMNVEKMVESLEKTNVISFQIATPSKAAAVGLDDTSTPTARIRFIAHLSENTPDEDAGDHTVMEVTFGKTIDDTLFARIGKAPELLEVPKETVNFLNVK